MTTSSRTRPEDWPAAVFPEPAEGPAPEPTPADEVLFNFSRLESFDEETMEALVRLDIRVREVVPDLTSARLKALLRRHTGREYHMARIEYTSRQVLFGTKGARYLWIRGIWQLQDRDRERLAFKARETQRRVSRG